jgi:Flp pilus assembly protein TadD
MSRAKSSLLFAALSVIASTAACTSVPDKEELADRELEKAVNAARKPATAEEIAVANRADPLTKANFWGKEHAKNPEDLQTALNFAQSLRAIGSDNRAIEVLSQILVVHPNSADVCMMLGRAFVRTGAQRPAITAFLRAAEIDPKRAEAWSALGTALDRMDQHGEAQKAYAQALALDPNRVATLSNYGLSLALSGNLNGAEEKLRKAVSLPGATAQVNENLALVIGLQGRYAEMKAVSIKSAPPELAEANAAAIQAMIEPQRTWEKVSGAAAPAPTAQDKVEPRAPGLRLGRSDG